MSDFDKFIKILKLNDYYSAEELKKAYRKAVIENHPDKFQDVEEKKRATERMKKINEAYEYLKDYTQTDFKDENNYEEDYENYEDETDYEDSERDSYEETESANSNKKKTNSFEDLIKILEYAINTQSQVKIKYINRNNQVSERVILPFEIVYGLYEKDKIYLIAYCLVKNKDLTFRLDRILNAQRIKESEFYNRPEERTVNETFENNREYKPNNQNITKETSNWKEILVILFIILLFIDWRIAILLLFLWSFFIPI